VADEDLHDRIERLVREEHRLIALEDARLATDADRARLEAVREDLDRTWEMLRRRRAQRAAARRGRPWPRDVPPVDAV
jgi:hypothetical protein